MEKNENGIPRMSGDGRGAMPNGVAGDSTRGTVERQGAGECNGLGGRLPEGYVNLAYVYAPIQKFCMLYSAKDALDHGTLFEGLYKPREVYYNE